MDRSVRGSRVMALREGIISMFGALERYQEYFWDYCCLRREITSARESAKWACLHKSVVASTRTCDFVGVNVIVRCGMGHIFMVWFSGSHVHDTTCTHDWDESTDMTFHHGHSRGWGCFAAFSEFGSRNIIRTDQTLRSGMDISDELHYLSTLVVAADWPTL